MHLRSAVYVQATPFNFTFTFKSVTVESWGAEAVIAPLGIDAAGIWVTLMVIR